MKRIALLATAAAAVVLPAVPAQAARRLSAQDKTYLQSSAQGDIFEITGGKMALRKSGNTAVRRLARTLVRDHTKSLKETERLAAAHGLTLPSAATPPEQWELAVVRTYKGRKFDKWYSALEINDHQQDIKDASDEASDGLNPSVKKSARQEIPELRMHLTLSRRAWAAS